MKYFQFFKFCREREKTLIGSTLNEEKKLGKGGLCFITGCFIEPFKMIIIFTHFYRKYITLN